MHADDHTQAYSTWLKRALAVFTDIRLCRQRHKVKFSLNCYFFVSVLCWKFLS